MNIAIVTGASSGLGRVFFYAVARNFPELDEIWVVARRRERLEELAAGEYTGRVRPVVLDLGDRTSYGKLEWLLKERDAKVSVLINNAGYAYSAPFAAMSGAAILSTLDVNVVGATMVNRVCIPYMTRGSFIVMTCSISSFAPIPYQSVYSASKAYVRFLGTALRRELRKQGIGLLVLCPGNMDTEMNPKTADTRNPLPFLDMEPLAERALKRARRGKGRYTPGFVYRIYQVLCKLCPASLVAGVAGNLFEE